MIALVTNQGTAAAETGLCLMHDTESGRRWVESNIAPQASDIVPGSWIDVSDNPEVECAFGPDKEPTA